MKPFDEQEIFDALTDEGPMTMPELLICMVRRRGHKKLTIEAYYETQFVDMKMRALVWQNLDGGTLKRTGEKFKLGNRRRTK